MKIQVDMDVDERHSLETDLEGFIDHVLINKEGKTEDILEILENNGIEIV